MKSEFNLMRKVLFVSSIFLLAVIIPFFLFMPRLATQISLTQEQLQGTEYFLPTYALLKAVEEHRASTLRYLAQPNPYDQAVILQTQGEIEGAFNRLAAIDRQYGERFNTSGVFMSMRHNWSNLMQQSAKMDVWESIQAHNRFISENILPFIRLFADQSKLPLNQNPTGFYAAASLVYTLPQLTETLGRMQAYGIEFLIDKEIAESERILLVYILNEAKINFTAVQNSMESIMRGEIAFQPQLRQGYASGLQATELFFKQYEERLLHPSANVTEEFPIDHGQRASDRGKPRDLTTDLVEEKVAQEGSAAGENVPGESPTGVNYPATGNLRLLKYSEEATTAINEIFKLSYSEIGLLKNSLTKDLAGLQTEKLLVSFIVWALVALALGVCFLVMRRMSNRLLNLQTVSKNLSPMVGELAEASGVIVLEAVKVSVNMADVSGTVEQVGQMALHSIQNARSVLTHADNVVRLSEVGKKSNDAISAYIHRINSQVASIEQITNSLQNQSLAIGSIISSMEELTRQSNLLALNAALEAIKAGEYGKGFDVVAQEINRLAKQSQQATDHIRSILDDIKVSVDEAVALTKQGRESVGLGVKQSLVADQSFSDLSKSVAEARQAAGYIVDSSEKQFAGVERIIIAFKDVKRGSMQNAEKIKRVQQSTKTLQELSFTIKTHMDRLQL